MVMHRRRLLESGEETPLYPSYKGNIGVWQVTGSITGNVINAIPAQGNRNVYLSDTRCEGSQSNMTSTWFHFNSGDTVEILITDISYTNSATASNYINISLYNTSKTIISESYTRLGGTGYTFGTGSGTIPDTSHVLSSAPNANIGSVRIYFQYAVNITFTLKIKVNGVLYAI